MASLEYIFQAPANRIGSSQFTLTQLKVMQECITLCIFTVYAFLVYRETLKWNNVVSMALIIAAVFFAFQGGAGQQTAKQESAAPPQSEKSE